jgi:hypothetical protein
VLQGSSVFARRKQSTGSKSARYGGAILDARQTALFRARQLQAIVDVTPWIVFSNIVNAIVTLYFSIDVWPQWVSIAWFSAVILVGCAGLPLWRATRRQPLQAVSPRVTFKVTVHGGVLALLWAVIPALAFL